MGNFSLCGCRMELFRGALSLKIIWVGFRSGSCGLVGDVPVKCSNTLIWLTVWWVPESFHIKGIRLWNQCIMEDFIMKTFLGKKPISMISV